MGLCGFCSRGSDPFRCLDDRIHLITKLSSCVSTGRGFTPKIVSERQGGLKYRCPFYWVQFKGTFSGLCRKNQKSSQKTENERGEKSLWHKAFRPRTCVKKAINSCYTSVPFFDVLCSNLLSGYGRSDCKAFSDRPSRRCFALF